MGLARGHGGVSRLELLGRRGEILAVFTREGVAQFGSYLKNFWPPATDAAFLSVVAQAVLETLAISIGGTAIASVIAMGLLYFASSV